MASIKIRAKENAGVVKVKTLIQHPMETGLRKDSKGKVIPAHFIKEVSCEYDGQVIMTANWSQAVSKNPYMSFQFKGASKGDTIKITWSDNKDKSDSLEAEIK